MFLPLPLDLLFHMIHLLKVQSEETCYDVFAMMMLEFYPPSQALHVVLHNCHEMGVWGYDEYHQTLPQTSLVI